MGFYATETPCLPRPEAGCDRPQETYLPPKNRVGGFSTSTPDRARRSAPQTLEPHRENAPTPTTTASGVRFYGYRFYSPEVGRWISQDPASERGGLNLYGFVWNAPTRMYDPLGLAPQLCGIDANGMPIYCDDPDPCWGHCPPDDGEPSEPDLSACEGYKQFFGSKCKDKDGCEVDDTYPEDAYNICRSFLEMYDNDASRCVAKCLIGKESGCQGKEKCRDRGLCRVGGHFSCYAGCGFIPWKGFPDGSWDVGSGQLF